MLSRLMCTKPLISQSLVKSSLSQYGRTVGFRQIQRDTREAFSGRIRQKAPTLKERAMAPPSANAYGIGKGALAGGAAIGIGALCFYGAGLGQGSNALENSHLWPQYVKERIQSTYMYFGASCALSAGAAMAVFRTPAVLNLVARNGWVSIIATMAAMIGSGMIAQSIPYTPGFGTKQMAWMVHCGILGAVIAPICFVGGPIITRAAMYTAGVVGGLSTVAVCAPSDKFLYMGGPLAIGLGVVFASSLAGMWLPPTTALGAGLYSMSLYGGLLLFSGFMLYDTQKIIKRAEMHPMYAERQFDPINSAISIYMDTLNIFIRIVSILAGGGGMRKK